MSTILIPVVIPQATPTTLLYADFTNSTLPDGWLFQGAASFMGVLNASTGAGGILIFSGNDKVGAIIYSAPITAQNIVIELSGMYGLHPMPGGVPSGIADDIGVGFYSGGPSANGGGRNPAAVNGYYAAYEFYVGLSPALMYNGGVLSSGAQLPSSGVNYLLTQTIVTVSSISMNALSTSSSPFMAEPSISLSNILTYDNATIDNSLSTFYIGGASGAGGTDVYVYWVRILSYPTTPTSPLPPLPIPEFPAPFLVLVPALTVLLLAIRVRRRK
jgi:hypothetical protein